MTSTAELKYVQIPSKVVHIRNLPWSCTEQELVEVCKPFGSIVNTKCNADINQAISMISYFSSSSEPAQVRGRPVYVQYADRQEISKSKLIGDTPGKVLMVTFEGIVPGDVSLDVFHWVFSAFGFVHKIVTFEKYAGFHALVQFADSTMATAAKDALDGWSIPGYLLPEKVRTCQLRILFSAHTDLQMKFQSNRSRDYTNLNLPVASAMSGIAQGFCIGPELESNVLLASFANMRFVVTIDMLYAVFSAFGIVQKIVTFDKTGFQALVQYPDIPTAMRARQALEGHSIYNEGSCKLHLTYSHHTNLNVKGNRDRSRDYTSSHPSSQASVIGQRPSVVAASSTGSARHEISASTAISYPGYQLFGHTPPAQSGFTAGWNTQVQGVSPFQRAYSTAAWLPLGASLPTAASGLRLSNMEGFNYQGPASDVHYSAPMYIPGHHSFPMPVNRTLPGHVGAGPSQYGNVSAPANSAPSNPHYHMFHGR